MRRTLWLSAFLFACGAPPDPFDEYLRLNPETEYKTQMELPCVATVRSGYPASTHDVVANLQLAREILDEYGVVEFDTYCERFFLLNLSIFKTTLVSEPNVLGETSGHSIKTGNDMAALVHEMNHYVDFLKRDPDWAEHNWPRNYFAADEAFMARKNRVCFKMEEGIACQIVTVVIE